MIQLSSAKPWQDLRSICWFILMGCVLGWNWAAGCAQNRCILRFHGERAKMREKKNEAFVIPLSFPHPQGNFPRREASFIETVTNSFFLLPSEAKVSLCASWSKGQLRVGNSFQQEVGKVLGNFDSCSEGSTDLPGALQSPGIQVWAQDWAAPGNLWLDKEIGKKSEGL